MTKTVYKYLSPDRISYFDNELLRFTPPADLNDPFECSPILPTQEEIISIVKLIAEENLNEIKNSKISKSEKKNLINNYERKIKSEITAIRKNLLNNFLEQFNNRSNDLK